MSARSKRAPSTDPMTIPAMAPPERPFREFIVVPLVDEPVAVGVAVNVMVIDVAATGSTTF